MAKAAEFPKEVEVEGVRLKQLSETEWEGAGENGVDFHIVEEEDGETPFEQPAEEGRYTVELFRAGVGNPAAAHITTFGAASLAEAVIDATQWVVE